MFKLARHWARSALWALATLGFDFSRTNVVFLSVLQGTNKEHPMNLSPPTCASGGRLCLQSFRATAVCGLRQHRRSH
jgi:hypothetical protein